MYDSEEVNSILKYHLEALLFAEEKDINNIKIIEKGIQNRRDLINVIKEYYNNIETIKKAFANE